MVATTQVAAMVDSQVEQKVQSMVVEKAALTVVWMGTKKVGPMEWTMAAGMVDRMAVWKET